MGILAWKARKVASNCVDTPLNFMRKHGDFLVVMFLMLLMLGIPIAILIYVVYVVYAAAGFWSALVALIVGILFFLPLFE